MRRTNEQVERDLDRDSEREPSVGQRRRVPLNENGAVRVRHIPKTDSAGGES